MSGPKTLVVVNPVAGGGQGASRWRRVQSMAGRSLTFQEHWTTRPGEATEVAGQAAAAGVERILAVGGDGTLHEIANGIAKRPPAVAVFPVGTGNDFARALGFRLQPYELFKRLANGHTRRVDLGRVHRRYYVLAAGAGFDASVAEAVNAMSTKQGGTVPYLRTAIAQAFRFRVPDLRLELDGIAEPVAKPRLMVAVANAPVYAGGMRICPPAEIDDGRLHAVAVGNVRGWSTLAMLVRVYSGRHLTDPRVSVASVRRLRIEGPPDTPVHADGELVGALPATFEVCPSALTLWVPSLPLMPAPRPGA